MDKLIDKYCPANYEDCFRQTLIVFTTDYYSIFYR